MATIEELEKRLNLLEAESAVRKLQYAYGYYLDKCLYNEVIDLYTEDGECKFMGAVYRGRPSLKRLYLDRFGQGFTKGTNRNVHGFLLDHAVMQFIIDVAPDGNSAKIRGRKMMQCGTHESVAPKDAPMRQWWEGGIYEMFEYILGSGYDASLDATFHSGKILGLYHKLLADFRCDYQPPTGSYHNAPAIQEFETGIDEEISFPGAGLDFTRLLRGVFESADRGGAHGYDAAGFGRLWPSTPTSNAK